MIYFVAAFKTGAVQFGPFADEKAAEKIQAWIAIASPRRAILAAVAGVIGETKWLISTRK